MITFHVTDGGSSGSFDGLGDAVSSLAHPNIDSGYGHSWYVIERTTAREVAALTEFFIPNLTSVITGYRSDTRITNVISAILQVDVKWDRAENDNSRTLGLFGYAGNGRAEA